MKIILIITGLGMGGAERQVCSLADKLIEKGHNVTIISLTGKAIAKPNSASIEIIELNMLKTPIGLLKALNQTRKIVKRIKPNAVHSHMIHANIFTRLLRLFVKIPKLICTAHNTNEGGKLRQLAYRYTDKLADLTTNVSQEAVDIFIKQKIVPANKIQFVPNGIDADKFKFSMTNRLKFRGQLNLTDSDILFMAVGRLNIQKNYPNLLNAFAKLKAQSNQSMQLAIIGQGELEAEMRLLSQKLRISEYIHFLGLQMNVEEWLSAADYYVLSSSWEGSPLVITEAMLSERLVIATDCGGVKEVLGNYGLLTESQNAEKLATGMQEAINMPEYKRVKMTQNAREKVINVYSLDRIADQWIKLYQ